MSVRIKIPIPPEAQLPLVIVGGLTLLAVIVLSASARIAAEGAKGWWLVFGIILCVVFAAALLWFFGQEAVWYDPYFMSAALLAVAGSGALLCLVRADRFSAAMFVSGTAALVLVAKLLFQAPVVLAHRPEGGILPAPWSHPSSLLLLLLTLSCAGMALWCWKTRTRLAGAQASE